MAEIKEEPCAFIWNQSITSSALKFMVKESCLFSSAPAQSKAVWTHILTAPIHYKGSIDEQVMQCYISPNLKKKLIYILDNLRG
ncbi:hypothetical protein QQF64_030955 [Cirrhinus molitorella]|uniref:Uncharacterized protein n=1 Tax=Cirrhinus molitorella TaxID=172907 RepID=A0ABR3N4S3_9TELE